MSSATRRGFVVVFSALALLMSFTPDANAGVTYQFESKSGSRRLMSGRVSIEGRDVRIDVERGDRLLFADGSILVSRDGGTTLSLIDPRQKTWSLIDLPRLFSSFADLLQTNGGTINVGRPQISVRQLGPGGKIEGYDTRRYQVDTTYDVTLTMMGAGVKSRIATQSTIWSTAKLPRAYATFIQQSGLRTGIPNLDAAIEQQSAAVEGFPLRQTTTTSLTLNGRATKTTSSVEIRNVRAGRFVPTAFDVPKGFRKVDHPLLTPKK